ncbi:MAG: ATP-dependent Clp protease ATP-binding subunit ClpB, partial [Paracoccaceae bacterium]
KIQLDIDEAAQTWLADQGYDPIYGARPLKRVIQKALQDPLAELLLGGKVLDGAEVEVTVDGAGLVIDGIGNGDQPPEGVPLQ